MAGDDARTYPPIEEEPAAARKGSSPLPDDPAFRYEDLGWIGKGSMGEVLRVHDRDLQRTVAMKIVRGSLQQDREVLDRFRHEAQATAQLEHPGIVPVYDFGVLPDGRFYFTMKEVVGTTLREVIAELHRPGVRESRPWTLVRAVDALRRACDAVAYAHARGVVHRDLKPENVMVGGFGEVLVLDWGLARALPEAPGSLPPIRTSRTGETARRTLPGLVAGTPSYMAPEQAAGGFSDLGPSADVYALGAVLYEILLGRPAFDGTDPQEAIARVLAGPPDQALPSTYAWGTLSRIDLPGSKGPAVPRELVRICKRAMAREAGRRYPDAAPLAADLTAWLDGSRRRERAKERLLQAQKLLPEVGRTRSRASALREKARQQLDAIPAHAPAEDKAAAWALQDQADDAERKAAVDEAEALQLLQGALALAPDLDEAHDALAAHYRTRHEQAEAHGAVALAARYEAVLRAHDTGRHTAYLDGAARLVLLTDTPDAAVELVLQELRARRLVDGATTALGRTPLASVRIPHGSSILRIRKPGYLPVTYPVHVGRLEHWDGVAPGGFGAHPVHLPPEGSLEPDDCYVPAGWFRAGAGPEAVGAPPPARVWVDAFVVRRYPVTTREYLVFLDALDAAGRGGEATRRVPRAQDADGALQDPLLVRGDNGFARAGAWKGWGLDWPITCIDWFDAMAYARWMAERTGKAWRLPAELEWEKAARGCDGRVYPWGNAFDPSFCNMRDSHGAGGVPVAVDAFVADCSPYGVRDLAGNVRELCLDAYRLEGPLLGDGGRALVTPPDPDDAGPRVDRGGSWASTSRDCRAASRRPVAPARRSPARGFRLARSL